MTAARQQTAFTLEDKSMAARWGLLLAISIAFITVLEWIHLPAALLLGSLSAAILVSAGDAKLAVPRWPVVIAQGLVGCLVARSLGTGILHTIVKGWPTFLAGVGMVLLFSAALGALLARWKVLPGSTAIWGTCPGAATVMVLMSESFGGDPRLVAFMQYFRVMMVALAAALVARLWGLQGGGAHAEIEWFPAFDVIQLGATLMLAIAGAIAGEKLKIPAGALLLPMALGAVLAGFKLVTIVLPPWLMAIAYALVGWTIGLKFTRPILLYAAGAFPKIAVSTITLIALCGALAGLLHWFAGIDPLTAYLATSPGGADSVAIIAAASKADVPFVMAMQTARFMLVMLVGPTLARAVARWADR